MRIERGKPFAAETVGVDTYQMIPVPNLAVGLWSVSANDRLPERCAGGMKKPRCVQ